MTASSLRPIDITKPLHSSFVTDLFFFFQCTAKSRELACSNSFGQDCISPNFIFIGADCCSLLIRDYSILNTKDLKYRNQLFTTTILMLFMMQGFWRRSIWAIHAHSVHVLEYPVTINVETPSKFCTPNTFKVVLFLNWANKAKFKLFC